MDKKKYPIGAEHYTLYEEVGQGVSASVHRALCIPFNEIVAVKILDFERDNSDLVNLRWILFLINKCFRISFTLMQFNCYLFIIIIFLVLWWLATTDTFFFRKLYSCSWQFVRCRFREILWFVE